MRKSPLIKVGIVLLLMLIFIGYNAYVKWDKSHFTIDSDAFNVKDSFSEVMDGEYQRLEGLKLADQFDKTKDIDITKDFPNKHRDLKIHKVWFIPGSFFILYSVNLQKDDQSPEDIPELNFSEVAMKMENGDAKTFHIKHDDVIIDDDVRIDDDEKYEGVVHDRRLYRGLALGVDFENMDAEDSKFLEQTLTDRVQMTLEQATLTKHEEDKDNDTKDYIENLTVTDSFSEDDDKLATIPIDEEIVLDNGQSLEFQHLNLTMFDNILYLHAEANNSTIQTLGASITWDGEGSNEDVYTRDVSEHEGDHFISFVGFEDIPSQLDIDLKSISYTRDENIQFDILTNSDLPESSQKIGEIEGISFYFEGYEKEDDMTEEVIGLKLGWESSGEKSIPTDSYNNMLMNHDLQKQLDSMELEETKETTRNSATNILSIQNENGEGPEYTDPTYNPDHANAVTSGNSIMVYLDNSYVKNSEEIHISIENFTYHERLEQEPFQINIPDEYLSGEGTHTD